MMEGLAFFGGVAAFVLALVAQATGDMEWSTRFLAWAGVALALSANLGNARGR